MSTIREGITSFLRAREADSPYLIPRWSVELESQFLVHPGSAETEEGSKVWTDGEQEWSNHRWPYKAGSNPSYRDKTLRFDPSTHVSRVGTTWWNWEKKRSIAVAFDIDMEGDHAPSTTTVTDTELDAVVDRLKKLPFVTLIRSTGGKGVHVYVFFNESDRPIAHHHGEHTDVALATLALMNEKAEYNFNQHMDVKGVVFWFWSDTSPAKHPGFSLIQEATESIGAADIAQYRGQNLKKPTTTVKVYGFNDSGQPADGEVEGNGYKVYPLDDEHKSILMSLEKTGFTFMWNAEFNMAHTHTCALKEVFEQRKAEGRPLRGIFETVSQGTDKGKPNCYITPRPNGVFQVKRFGNSTGEHPSWNTKDGSTWCYFNQDVDIDSIFRRFCQKFDNTSKGKKFIFEPSKLKEAMEAAGHEFNHPLQGAVQVFEKADGTFFAKTEETIAGWKQGKDGCTLTLPVVASQEVRTMSILEEVDDIARVLITDMNDMYGYAAATNKGWVVNKGLEFASPMLKKRFGKDIEDVKSTINENPWTLTCQPFKKEYLPNRVWNKNAPQLAIEPASENGPHPHWDMIYEHLGKSLDEAVKNTIWCQQWGLQSGADYLRCWMAALIVDAMEPLPYLFFYGPQNSGKSIFHESASLLFTRGAVHSAKDALTNPSGFNYEIANCVLGFIEEKDLSHIKDTAYSRMKEWVTGRTITITEKGKTPYSQVNFLKMVQMANSPTACPMEDGDTRITALAVSILGDKQIPKGLMEKRLKDEAPYFLRTLLQTHLPETPERLRVPMLSSRDKQDLEAMNQKPWEAFAADNLVTCEGHLIKFTDFHREYIKFCTLNNLHAEKPKTLLSLIRNRGDRFVVGRGKGNQTYIANVRLLNQDGRTGVPYILDEDSGRLVKCVQ